MLGAYHVAEMASGVSAASFTARSVSATGSPVSSPWVITQFPASKYSQRPLLVSRYVVRLFKTIRGTSAYTPIASLCTGGWPVKVMLHAAPISIVVATVTAVSPQSSSTSTSASTRGATL